MAAPDQLLLFIEDVLIAEVGLHPNGYWNREVCSYAIDKLASMAATRDQRALIGALRAAEEDAFGTADIELRANLRAAIVDAVKAVAASLRG